MIGLSWILTYFLPIIPANTTHLYKLYTMLDQLFCWLRWNMPSDLVSRHLKCGSPLPHPGKTKRNKCYPAYKISSSLRASIEKGNPTTSQMRRDRRQSDFNYPSLNLKYSLSSVQSQKAVTANFSSKQLSPFGFAEQFLENNYTVHNVSAWEKSHTQIPSKFEKSSSIWSLKY